MKNSKGFTLIELMLVVIIIGVLASLVVPRLVGRSEEARIAAAKADINANISVALDLYELLAHTAAPDRPRVRDYEVLA
ncbi:MAG: prepilin-type N-terminal cleavage/methylation domain-containing protein, partial [Candidatus Omnitrophica bacterium]|nr:prepilin-type N-terminal cleavage/methylation domain-containing protein [Candidatus Omnitrophota bacterium]